ncbi:hypothetical protein [uncultured Polaribacter sp.]|uniref:hypothetical protein n=1 Tax=uncultured Polaribacter sp. TaxID=174711 RepID=UPI00261752F9|nr:hypothetical protein [uncultured Polaribacter sp.]
MQIKKIFLATILIIFISCSEDNDITTPRNLQEYLDVNSDREIDNVIACAASLSESICYIYYYPVDGATEIRYYETDGTDVDETDFSNYRRSLLDSDDVFDGTLQKFSRSDSNEAWSIVTYLTDGKFHISDPIRLKNTTSETIWEEDVTIEYPSMLTPKFTWSDYGITDNVIYFQVISDADDTFLSGTYTTDNYFQYYDTSNVVLNITEDTPDDLIEDEEYNFTLMGVSEDNWVNLIIEQTFIAE